MAYTSGGEKAIRYISEKQRNYEETIKRLRADFKKSFEDKESLGG